MHKFEFRLERVLRMREATARAAESVLERERARRFELESELEALKLSAAKAGREVKAQQWVRMFPLTEVEHYTNRVDRETKELLARIAKQIEVIRRQEAVVVEARRNVRLLEKLRDQRWKEWQAEADRESQKLTADYLAALWVRERREAL